LKKTTRDNIMVNLNAITFEAARDKKICNQRETNQPTAQITRESEKTP
jgi:hypothetical protein